MSSGIKPTRTERVGEHAEIGYGIPWASGEPDEPEEPVWFGGVREDVPCSHPLRPRWESAVVRIERAVRHASSLHHAGWRVHVYRAIDVAMTVSGSLRHARRLLDLDHDGRIVDALAMPAGMLETHPIGVYNAAGYLVAVAADADRALYGMVDGCCAGGWGAADWARRIEVAS